MGIPKGTMNKKSLLAGGSLIGSDRPGRRREANLPAGYGEPDPVRDIIPQ